MNPTCLQLKYFCYISLVIFLNQLSDSLTSARFPQSATPEASTTILPYPTHGFDDEYANGSKSELGSLYTRFASSMIYSRDVMNARFIVTCNERRSRIHDTCYWH